MTKQEIYEWVVRLTAELHATNFAREIFNAVENEDSEKFDSTFKSIKQNDSGLYLKIFGFGKICNDLESEERGIFGDAENKKRGIFLFDADKIDALSFFALTILADIDDMDFFENWGSQSSKVYLEAIEETGYLKLHKFIENYSWKQKINEYSSLYKFFIDIFKGKFEEDDE